MNKQEEPKMALRVLECSVPSSAHTRDHSCKLLCMFCLCKSHGFKEGNKAEHEAVIRVVLCEKGNRTCTLCCVNHPQVGKCVKVLSAGTPRSQGQACQGLFSLPFETSSILSICIFQSKIDLTKTKTKPEDRPEGEVGFQESGVPRHKSTRPAQGSADSLSFSEEGTF